MNKLSFLVLMFAGCLQAADYCFTWDKAFPDSGDEMLFKDENGRTRVRLSLFYTNITSSLSSPKKWCVENVRVYADKGGTVTFTGEPMTFIMPKNQSRIYFYTNECRLVFKNVVTNRITEVYYMEPDDVYTKKWNGGTEFVTGDWKKVLDGADLDDWQPSASTKQTNPGANELTSGWENRGNTFHAKNFVRHGTEASFQYRSELTTNNGEWYYKVVKMQLKQGADGIYARALSPTYKVVVPDGKAVDFDVDAVGAGPEKIEKRLFVNDGVNKSGYGINTVEFRRERPLATVRYENKAYFSSTVRPHGNIRIEFAGDAVSKSGQSTFMLTESFADVAFVDTSLDWTVNGGTTGSGRIFFERTKPGESKVVLSGTVQNKMTSDGEYVVRGTPDGSGKMVLEVASDEQLPQSNNVIRVEHGGEFVLNLPSAECDNPFTVVVGKGGVFRQKSTRPFKLGVPKVVVDGGTAQFNYGNKNDLYLYDNLVLKNGALMTGSAERAFVQLHGKAGSRLVVCGDSPSTNNAGVSLMSASGVVCSNIFHVLKTGNGAFAYDFVQNGDILEYQGSAPYAMGRFCKTGDGTMFLGGKFTSTNEAIVADGKVVFGENVSWGNTKNGFTAAPIAIENAAVETVPGKILQLGRLSRVEGEARLVLGAGSAFEFEDSSGCAAGWAEDATLDIAAPEGAYVKFGSGTAALALEQRKKIRFNGKAATLNSEGVVCGIGFSVIIR